MKAFILWLCVAAASAQFSQFGNVWPPSYYRQCPVHLLNSLASIVSRLYGQGSFPNGNPYLTRAFGSSYASFPAASGLPRGAGFIGYQATTPGSPYNPQCPWPLMRSMIAQIQQYVNQLQASQQGGVIANNPFASFAARGVFPAVGRSPAPFRFGSLGTTAVPFGDASLRRSPFPLGGASLGRSPFLLGGASVGRLPVPFGGASVGRSPAPESAMGGSPSSQVEEDVMGGSSYIGGLMGGPAFRGRALQFGGSTLSGSYYGGLAKEGSPFRGVSSPFSGTAMLGGATMETFRPTALGWPQNFPGVGAVSRFQRKK